MGKPMGIMTTLVVSLVVSLTACADGAETTPTSDASPQASGPGVRWLAAIDVAPRADDLDRVTERLRDPLGSALVVSPVDCFEGLPDEAGQGYVIGAIADSREAAEQLVVEAEVPVLFVASVTILCTD